MNKLYWKYFDFISIAICIGIISAAAIITKKDKSDEQKLLVISAPDGEYIYTLDHDAIYEISGKLGISKIEVRDGKVKFEDSPCPTKSCTFVDWIQDSGEWSACLPNKIFVRIEGKKNSDDLDGISR